jgi:putative ATPase
MSSSASSTAGFVDCPICDMQVSINFINHHIDSHCNESLPTKRSRTLLSPAAPPVVQAAAAAVDEPTPPVTEVDVEQPTTTVLDGPLAHRMRPQSLREFKGHDAVVAAIELMLASSNMLPSMIFWGPSGCGKTTLARIIAAQSHHRFAQVSGSAVMSDLRAVFQAAKSHRQLTKTRTVLFVDELHRLSTVQQDALLPHVECGDVVLLGATTENPSFSCNAALLSRATVFVLKPLSEDDLSQILARAARNLSITLSPDGAQTLVGMCGGDARSALNALEQAAAVAAQTGRDVLDRELVLSVVRSTPQAMFGSETHYDVISALHKSIRGSNVDAALIFLARMLDGGDPLYVARRLVRAAAEDVGMADPNALVQAQTCLDAVKSVGMPECDVILAQCVVYLAMAPKSRAVSDAMDRARALVASRRFEVPLCLRNAPTRLMKELGYGAGEERFVPAEFEAEVARVPVFQMGPPPPTGQVASGGKRASIHVVQC